MKYSLILLLFGISTLNSVIGQTTATVEGMHNAYVTFEQGIYQQYKIGTTPGGDDLYAGEVIDAADFTAGHFSIKKLQSLAQNQGVVFPERGSFYISLWSEGEEEAAWISEKLSFQPERYGKPVNKVTFEIDTLHGLNGAEPFTAEEGKYMLEFYELVAPIIYEIYGPPVLNQTVRVIKDPFSAYTYKNHPKKHLISAGFLPANKESFNDPNNFLFALLKSWRGAIPFSRDENDEESTNYMVFEDGMAFSASMCIMDLFVQRNPDYFAGNELIDRLWDEQGAMDYYWRYDFANHPQVVTQDFLSAGQGTGMFWARYGLAGAVFRKCYVENFQFYKRFNQIYFNRVNSYPILTPDRDLAADVMELVMPSVEYTPTRTWMDEQYILTSEIVPGRKVVATSHTNGSGYSTFQQDLYIHHIETHSSGNEWKWDVLGEDGELKERWYHQLNNTEGTFQLENSKGELVHEQSIKMDDPVDVGPDQGGNVGPNFDAVKPLGISRQKLHLLNRPELNYVEDQTEVIPNLTETGLYKYKASFTHGGVTATLEDVMILGELFIGSDGGVSGGIMTNEWAEQVEGTLWIEHEYYEEEDPITITNNAFEAPRRWTRIEGGREDEYFSQPGQVHAIYVSPDCSTKKIDFRNIGYGEPKGKFGGNQLFLFNVDKMDDIRFDVPESITVCENQEQEIRVESRFEDVFEYDSRVKCRWIHEESGDVMSESMVLDKSSISTNWLGDCRVEIDFYGCPTQVFSFEMDIEEDSLFELNPMVDIVADHGGDIQLTVDHIFNAKYQWTGPNEFSSTLREPVIRNISKDHEGEYEVTVTKKNCEGNEVFDKETVYLKVENVDGTEDIDWKQINVVYQDQQIAISGLKDLRAGVSIIGADGRVVRSFQEVTDGALPFSGISQGIYLVYLRVDKNSYPFKILVN